MPGNASIVSTPSRKKPGGRARKSKAAAVLERSPVLGWLTSDEDEIALRRWRGRTEGIEVVALEPQLRLLRRISRTLGERGPI